jgi:nicotinamide phosphoribosyltransferase
MNIFMPHAKDFYKSGHVFQYPKGTEYVYSNWTCRSDKWASVLPDFAHKVVFFGLQGVCQWMLIDDWNTSFFSQPLKEVVNKYRRRMDKALGTGRVTVDHIAALHVLGYLPARIKALPEGSRVDTRVPMWTIVNTLPEFFWVTNF